MDKNFQALKDKSLLIVFAYAPAGLGHLRVTDALYHGLPKDINTPLLLGSQDQTITYLHRLMSLNPIISRLADFIENNDFIEEISTIIYRKILQINTKTLYQQITTIIDELYTPPTKLLVVATHFGLAHQISSIKKKLEKEKNLKVILVVQVTDDSPFKIWAVPQADLIFVPSEKTKTKLLQYAQKLNYQGKIIVNPYPINPNLNKPLSKEKLKEKLSQVDINKNNPIEIVIPISGAAVQTIFFEKLILELHKKSPRFVFHIVVKNAPFTLNFINKMSNLDFVHLSIGKSDRKVIENYEYIYDKNIIAFEITKPSEQAFKALIDPGEKSAPILLFSNPVGRQEKDNLDFLRRHQLIPNLANQKLLWQKKEDKNLIEEAKKWRGLLLPQHSKNAADFIFWCLKIGIFKKMVSFKSLKENHNELGVDGVNKFWQIVGKILL